MVKTITMLTKSEVDQTAFSVSHPPAETLCFAAPPIQTSLAMSGHRYPMSIEKYRKQ
jgi:hypothetical protein